MTFFLSPLTGRLGDRYGSRPISIVGGLFCSLGLILTSFVRKLDLFFLTYSILFGFGVSCCRTSNFLIVTKYFWKRRSLATGIVTAGAGLGVFTLAPLCHLLIDKHGLQGAYRVLGLVTLANCILPLPYDPNINEDEDPGKKKETFYNQGDYNPEECTAEASSKWRKLIDFSVWKVPLFTVTAACSTAVGIVTYTGQFHLVSKDPYLILCSLPWYIRSSGREMKLSPVLAFPCLPFAFPLSICISVFLHTNLVPPSSLDFYA